MAPKKHVISGVCYISLSRDWLSSFSFLNFHEDYYVVLTRERKRDGPRHSTTTFSEIVAVAETSSKC